MKINKNSYGKSILTMIMNTVRPKTFIQSDELISNKLGTINSNTNFLYGNYNYKNYVNKDNEPRKYDWCNIEACKYSNRSKAFMSTSIAGIYGDILYPINPYDKEFRASVRVIGEPIEDTREYSYLYYGVKSYDAEKRFIHHHMSYPYGQQTELVEDLKPNDTKIYVKDASRFVDSEYIRASDGVDCNAHKRSIIFHKLQDNGRYCYKSPEGTYYTELGYSRDVLYKAWKANSITKIDNNKYEIKLSSPYNGIYLPAGTKARNTRSGGTYNYWLSYRYFRLDMKEHNITSRWFTWDPDNIYDFYKFRNGTHYVSTMLLTHYSWRDKNGHVYGYSNDEFYEKANGKFKVWYTNLELQWRMKEI